MPRDLLKAFDTEPAQPKVTTPAPDLGYHTVKVLHTHYGDIELQRNYLNDFLVVTPLDICKYMDPLEYNELIYNLCPPDDKPRVVSNKYYKIEYIKKWYAEIGGYDKVQIKETGEIIPLKHYKQDPRYNKDTEPAYEMDIRKNCDAAQLDIRKL